MTSGRMTKRQLRAGLRDARAAIRRAEKVAFGSRGSVAGEAQPVQSALGGILAARDHLDALAQQIRPQFTVLGLRDSSGALIVAGAVPGSHDVAIEGPAGEFQRWAAPYDATSQDAAVAMAREECSDA